MRSLLWARVTSFVVYNAILALFSGKSPSVTSYLYGLVFFLGHFVLLLISALVGRAPLVARLCAGAGALVVVIVGWLSAINQAAFVAPAFLMLFGVFSVDVVLCVVVVRDLRRFNRVTRT